MTWIKCTEQLPPDETEVLIVVNGERRIGALYWDTPGFEDTYTAFRYWDDPDNDGRCWEWHDVTHWQSLPDLPPAEEMKHEDDPQEPTNPVSWENFI